MPVYIVDTPTGPRLIEAKSPNAAVKHVIGDTIIANVVSTAEMANLIKNGVVLEFAAAKSERDEQADEPVIGEAPSEILQDEEGYDHG